MLLEFAPFARVRVLMLTLQQLLPLFMEGTSTQTQCVRGVPAGATLMAQAVQGPTVALIFSHPEWDLIAQGQMIPPLELELHATPLAVSAPSTRQAPQAAPPGAHLNRFARRHAQPILLPRRNGR